MSPSELLSLPRVRRPFFHGIPFHDDDWSAKPIDNAADNAADLHHHDDAADNATDLTANSSPDLAPDNFTDGSPDTSTDCPTDNIDNTGNIDNAN